MIWISLHSLILWDVRYHPKQKFWPLNQVLGGDRT